MLLAKGADQRASWSTATSQRLTGIDVRSAHLAQRCGVRCERVSLARLDQKQTAATTMTAPSVTATAGELHPNAGSGLPTGGDAPGSRTTASTTTGRLGAPADHPGGRSHCGKESGRAGAAETGIPNSSRAGVWIGAASQACRRVSQVRARRGAGGQERHDVEVAVGDRIAQVVVGPAPTLPDRSNSSSCPSRPGEAVESARAAHRILVARARCW